VCSASAIKVRINHFWSIGKADDAFPSAFVDMLNAMRFANLTTDIIKTFQGLSRPVTYKDGIEPTEL
jgi:hypothetical protein